MEISFPSGNVELPMSDQVQNEFFKQMGKVVFDICVFNPNTLVSVGSGFCISKNGLILTAAHVVNLKEFNVSDLIIYARRHGVNTKFRCEIFAKSDEFDIALLRIVEIASSRSKHVSEAFDYVVVMNVDRIHVAREVFMIGAVRGQGIHMVRGTMAYEHNMGMGGSADLNLVTSKGKEAYAAEESTYYEDKSYRTAKGSWFSHDLSEPLPYLQINAIDNCKGLSGAAIFDSTGKVVGVLTSGTQGKCFGVPTNVFLQWLQDNMRV